jgi:hypothetical protein
MVSEKNNLGFINCWICMKHIQQGDGWEIWKSIEHRKDNISLFQDQDRSYLNFVQLLTPLVCKMKVKSKDEGLLNGPWWHCCLDWIASHICNHSPNPCSCTKINEKSK